jgi:hypothetical protein
MIYSILIIILVVLWLVGFLGADISSRIPKTGLWIHIFLVLAILLFVLKMMRIL